MVLLNSVASGTVAHSIKPADKYTCELGVDFYPRTPNHFVKRLLIGGSITVLDHGLGGTRLG